MRIAFYAPLKHPDHPVPSGDRAMARQLQGALRGLGHEVETVSDLRSFLAEPDAPRQAQLTDEAETEADRLAVLWSSTRAPDLWLTYHNHYKAPDLLGPRVARRFGLPLVVAEASHAPKRAALWGAWHEAAAVATHAADVHLCFTARDRAGIVPIVAPVATLVDVPPFIDLRGWPPNERPTARAVPHLVTVAMMRAGDKAQSYRFLAQALSLLAEEAWSLTVVGDGPEREAVRAMFAGIDPARITWTGLLPRPGVLHALHDGDIYVWPGFGEAYGLGYLEAQASGLPVVALDIAGVPSVVQAGRTGVLVGETTARAYADALRDMLHDAAGRQAMSQAARAAVRRSHTVERAMPVLEGALRTALGRIRPAA